jgi:hypothetical protein
LISGRALGKIAISVTGTTARGHCCCRDGDLHAPIMAPSGLRLGDRRVRAVPPADEEPGRVRDGDERGGDRPEVEVRREQDEPRLRPTGEHLGLVRIGQDGQVSAGQVEGALESDPAPTIGHLLPARVLSADRAATFGWIRRPRWGGRRRRVYGSTQFSNGQRHGSMRCGHVQHRPQTQPGRRHRGASGHEPDEKVGEASPHAAILPPRGPRSHVRSALRFAAGSSYARMPLDRYG